MVVKHYIINSCIIYTVLLIILEFVCVHVCVLYVHMNMHVCVLIFKGKGNKTSGIGTIWSIYQIFHNNYTYVRGSF